MDSILIGNVFTILAFDEIYSSFWNVHNLLCCKLSHAVINIYHSVLYWPNEWANKVHRLQVLYDYFVCIMRFFPALILFWWLNPRKYFLSISLSNFAFGLIIRKFTFSWAKNEVASSIFSLCAFCIRHEDLLYIFLLLLHLKTAISRCWKVCL